MNAEVRYTNEEEQEISVWVTSYADIERIVKEHGGDENHDFDLAPEGTDTPSTVIGVSTCNDGWKIRFETPYPGTRTHILNQMF